MPLFSNFIDKNLDEVNVMKKITVEKQPNQATNESKSIPHANKWLLAIGIALVLMGCDALPKQQVRKTTDELKEQLAQSNAVVFQNEVNAVYEIFPISFADANGDRHGDIQGIISRLDYLNDGDDSTHEDLGINAIWLTPIHPSESYHKYDVLDYKAIDPKFGTLEDFKELIAEADKRGIKIILDMVFNHSAYNHPWFQSAIKQETPYDEYYRLETELPKEAYPNRSSWYQANDLYYYGSFWDRMPELNADSQLVRDEFKDILTFWLDLGVSGFRYDAAKHMYDQHEFPTGYPLLDQTLQFWLEMKEHVKSVNEDAFLVAEVWLQTSVMVPYTVGFDSLFDFDFGTSVIAAINAGSKQRVVDSYLKNMIVKTSRNTHYVNSTFLTNHDQDRVMSVLGGDVAKGKLAAHILLTMPGTPFIYYGEELGMQGKKPDEQIREPMKWSEDINQGVAYWESWQYNVDTPSVEEQIKDIDSMLSMYRDLLRLRNAYPALRSTKMEEVNLKNSSLMSYLRMDETTNETVFVVHNMYWGPMEFEYEVGELIYHHGDIRMLPPNKDGVSIIHLAGQSTAIFKVGETR